MMIRMNDDMERSENAGGSEVIIHALVDDLLAFAGMGDRMYVSLLAVKTGLITVDQALDEASRMIEDMNRTIDLWEEYADLTE